MPVVLNVGGGSKAISIPSHYQAWEHLLLDIDPRSGADVVCDARLLRQMAPPGTYDAVYCSHNLEHYYPHDCGRVLEGFLHVLKPDGFAEIRVPDLWEVMKAAFEKGLDIEDELYLSPSGPIRVLDVIYGFQQEIARSGHELYAHKTGFTASSLERSVKRSGFSVVFPAPPLDSYELRVLAFKQAPNEMQCSLLGISI